MNEYIPPTLLAPYSPHYRMSLTVGEHSAAPIRRIARSLLEEWEMQALREATELALTELLANVVRHVPDRRCTLLILRQQNGVRVEVTDGSPHHPAPLSGLPLDSENGRGLHLVDAVTDKWGVCPAPGDGKTVWFECGAEEVSTPRP
ncbi:ATP-binding protein [Streptomyces sp. NPDC096205]|uniref:ATP-binding protein n=1 Tax=Streptomyces sp. NPDC096205 TaxID=3366081 RepID=UPI00380201F3